MRVQNKDGKRVLITDITGFVSTYLAKKLLEHDRPAECTKTTIESKKGYARARIQAHKAVEGYHKRSGEL